MTHSKDNKHKEWIGGIFDRSSSGYGEKGCSFFDYFGEKLVLLAPPLPGETVLDIATGKGAVLFPAAKMVGSKGSAIGIDISHQMIEEAKKKAPFPWIELKEMDAEHLTFPNHTFDKVFCAFALFFFPNLAGALSECKRVLKPNGSLAVSVWGTRPDLDQWIAKRVSELGASQEIMTTSLNTAESLKKALAQAGFSHIEIHEEKKTFWHKNAEEWWNALWSHGIRGKLEQLKPHDLENLKKEALLQAGKGRISDEKHVFLAIARL